MMHQEFNKIAGQVCDPEMYFNEVEPIYMEFEDISKREMAVLYWGQRKGAYLIYLEMKDLMRYINELKAVPQDQFGLVESLASIKISEMKFQLTEKVKALKIA